MERDAELEHQDTDWPSTKPGRKRRIRVDAWEKGGDGRGGGVGVGTGASHVPVEPTTLAPDVTPALHAGVSRVQTSRAEVDTSQTYL